MDNQDNIKCKICGKICKHLGSHLKIHKITARDYKIAYGLDYNFPLISDEVREKKTLAWEEGKEKYLKNLELGSKYRFKKGQKNRTYISRQSSNRSRANINKESHQGVCIVCKKHYKNVISHLFNKHGLVIADYNKYTDINQYNTKIDRRNRQKGDDNESTC